MDRTVGHLTIGVMFLLSLFVQVTYAQDKPEDTTVVIIADLPPFDITDWQEILPDTVLDVDSNVYHLQQLGKQVWFVENLSTTHFVDGSAIGHLPDSILWINTYDPAYCFVPMTTHYREDSDTNYTDHILYNRYTIMNDKQVCPVGFRVPTAEDWKILEEFVDSMNYDFSGSVYPLAEETDDTLHVRKDIFSCDLPYSGIGFSDQPYGARKGWNGGYILNGDFGVWHSQTDSVVAMAWARILCDRGFGIDDIHIANKGNSYEFIHLDQRTGLAIKCIQE